MSCSEPGEAPRVASLGAGAGPWPLCRVFLSAAPQEVSAPLTGSENLKLITHSKCCHQPKNNHLSKHSWLQHSENRAFRSNRD